MLPNGANTQCRNMTNNLKGEMYLQLLPSEEKETIKKIFSSLDAGNAGLVKEHNRLVQLLCQRPYPFLQLLNKNRDKSRYQIGKIITESLQNFLKTENQSFSLNFISFLSNFPIDILEAASVRKRLLSKLTEASALKDEIYFALLSRTDSKLLKDVLAHLKQQWQISPANSILTVEFILYQALEHSKHFAPTFSYSLKQFQNIKDIAIKNNLIILKILQEFNVPKQSLTEIGNISKWLDSFKVTDTPSDLQEVHSFFYADFQRFCVILGFLKKHTKAFNTLSVASLLHTEGILQLLYESETDVGFDETRVAIEALHKWQRQMPATRSTRNLELQSLSYYSALGIVYDVILADEKKDSDLESYYICKIQQLIATTRHLRSLNVLCNLLVDIFQLVFLRWEQLDANHARLCPTQHHVGAYRSKSHRSSANSDSNDADYGFETQTYHRCQTPSVRHGFICRGRALFNLFTFLKNFVTKKLHTEDYKFASETDQQRFQRIIEVINEALWKYTVLEKIDDSLIQADTRQKFQLEPEELLQLVRMHIRITEKTSSDDESRERCNYSSLARRKSIKKRRRATFSGGTRPKSGILDRPKLMISMNTSVNSGQNDVVAELRARHMVNRLLDRSIIPQMLGSPENLAIMALALKNFDDVKYIVETFNLQNSDLSRELHFVEQQQQVKRKLATMYASYQHQDQIEKNPNKPLATVEQIKTVAAKGFEVSKMISVIDNFAQTHKIQQTPELKQLLAKHISSNPQYGFLRNFEESNLNAVIVLDLILNLPLNRELTTNILMVIKRQQKQTQIEEQKTQNQETNNQNRKLLFPQDIGGVSFLENLAECLRLLQDKQSLSDLLTDNFYSLKPRQLAFELQRETTFHAIFNKPHSVIGCCSDLQALAPLFQSLQSKTNWYGRFSAYVTHLMRLIKLRDPNIEMNLSELLKTDPCEVIGELIFERDMTPLEIEANVAALNLNLVHVIALNICPEIGGRDGDAVAFVNAKKQETVLNYISQQNRLMAVFLESIITGRYFECVDKNLMPDLMQRYLELPEIETFAELYNGNLVIAALRSDVVNLKRLHGLSSKFKQLKILKLQIGNREYESKHKTEIDRILLELIQDDSRNIHLAEHINDLALKARLIQENFTKMATTRLAQQLIESTLQHKDAVRCIPVELRKQLAHTLVDIIIYAKVSEVLQFESWPQAYDFGLKTPNIIFQKLLRLHLYKLCYEWCTVVQLSKRFIQFKTILLAALLDALLELKHDDEMNTYLLRILETFSLEDCFIFLNNNKDRFRSLLLLQYSIEFLIKHSTGSVDCYRNYQVSIKIFEQLTQIERSQFWHLLKHPLLIMEQLIMNAKFETLTKVLVAARKSLHETQKGAVCGYCFDKRGHIYDIHTKTSSSTAQHKIHFKLGIDGSHLGSSAEQTAFMLLNFNLYQQDHLITHECIDLLLRIYATKALDYHISDTYSSDSERISQLTDMQQSLDSLCGTFQMPKVAPARADWIQDDEASHCMCCRRAAFTMLMRRHHCRRCGRVVCFACSSNRMLIPELYENVEVRVCSDCYRLCDESQQNLAQHATPNRGGNTTRSSHYSKRNLDLFKWQLSGNITHDKLLREEFCYEHAPSVALCLSILSYHFGQKKCVELLLYHCRKMEKLIVPNPEVDYELVAKMISCLALAAKLRGAPAEIESIRENSEIIMSVVQHGCEVLIPPGPLSNHNLRKLADSLVQAENWQLALEVHLKRGFPTAGVMAAHGLACLRAGCFDTAREKLSHCMPKLPNENDNSTLKKFLLQSHDEIKDNELSEWCKNNEVPKIRRPQRGPPLLQEILKIIESTTRAKPQPETLRRASIIRNSNTSIVSLLSRRKEAYTIPVHEPALNVLTTLASLKRIAKGDYGIPNATAAPNNSDNRESSSYEECLYYLLTYGSHADILQYLMQQQRLKPALRYFIVQNLDPELFIQHIFLICLKCGDVPKLIEAMLTFDKRLLIWQNVFLHTCRYLETHNLMHSLYQLQLLLEDPVRASMTCVKFYTMNCESFQQLHANAEHLHNAHKHLQSELELAKWENLNLEQNKQSGASFLTAAFRSRKNSTVSSRRSSNASTINNFLMQMDARSLNTHINTILLQLDVSKFLAKCERDYCPQSEELLTLKILKQIRMDSTKIVLPTLFGNATEKIQLCILILYCGKNIEEGFGMAYRIIRDYKLSPMKVFAATAKFLARNQRLNEVEHLLSCITSNNGGSGSSSNRDLDEIISVAINSAVNTHEPHVKLALDSLTKKIHAVELRISCHIFIGQLKSAYLLANKHERLNDIRKIMRQAELTNQIHIKRLCERKLSMSASATSAASEGSQ